MNTPSPSHHEPYPQTLAQKLIARASGQRQVALGEIAICEVDLAMFHDSSGPRRLQPMLEQLGQTIRDPSRVVLIMDHFTPAADPAAEKLLHFTRQWSRQAGLSHVYESEGICHVVLPQKGHLKPGMFCVGGDSHSTTGGALGCYMFGIGSTEMTGVLVTGHIWVKVPETMLLHWHGQLPDYVCAKDMMLHLLGTFGTNGANYNVVEFIGDTISRLPMQERMTLSNMCAELGAQTGLIAPDDKTQDYLAQAGITDHIDLSYWKTDADAPSQRHHFDAGALVPLVALPHSPQHVFAVDDIDRTHIDVAYIGACTGAKYEDLRAAASILKNATVSPRVKLMVAPASRQDQELAQREGILQTLLDAGATLYPNACGACSGYTQAFKGKERILSTTARNFRGRMGSDQASIYLASPYTVAASAITGVITSPHAVI